MSCGFESRLQHPIIRGGGRRIVSRVGRNSRWRLTRVTGSTAICVGETTGAMGPEKSLGAPQPRGREKPIYPRSPRDGPSPQFQRGRPPVIEYTDLYNTIQDNFGQKKGPPVGWPAAVGSRHGGSSGGVAGRPGLRIVSTTLASGGKRGKLHRLKAHRNRRKRTKTLSLDPADAGSDASRCGTPNKHSPFLAFRQCAGSPGDADQCRPFRRRVLPFAWENIRTARAS